MARELGDFTPHESEPGKGRLVREDENDASDDDDDDEKRRIVFSVKEKSQRQKIAEEIGNSVGRDNKPVHHTAIKTHRHTIGLTFSENCLMLEDGSCGVRASCWNFLKTGA